MSSHRIRFNSFTRRNRHFLKCETCGHQAPVGKFYESDERRPPGTPIAGICSNCLRALPRPEAKLVPPPVPASFLGKDLKRAGIKIDSWSGLHLECARCGTIWHIIFVPGEPLPENWHVCPEECNLVRQKAEG